MNNESVFKQGDLIVIHGVTPDKDSYGHVVYLYNDHYTGIGYATDRGARVGEFCVVLETYKDRYGSEWLRVLTQNGKVGWGFQRWFTGN